MEPPPPDEAPPSSLGKRLAWFVGLAVGGAAATAGVAYVLRALLFSA